MTQSFSRTEAAIYLTVIAAIFVAVLVMRADRPLGERVVIGFMGIVILFMWRAVANRFCEEAQAEHRQAVFRKYSKIH